MKGNLGGIRKDILVRYDVSILEIKSTRFAGRPDVGFERNRSTEDDSRVFDPNSRRIVALQPQSHVQPQGLQHARPPRPSPTPAVHPNSCPLSQ